MAGKSVTFNSGDGSGNIGGNLKIQTGAGDGTDKKAGDLILSTGDSTGNSSAAITFLTSVGSDSGSTTREPDEKMRIHTNGFVGIGTNAPTTLLQLEGDNAYLTLKNTTDENGDGQAETRISFQDHSSTSLSLIQGSHDGSGNDTKGKLLFVTNNNSSLITAMVIDSSQNTTLTGNLTTTDLILKDDANSSHNLTITANQSGGSRTLTCSVTANSTLTLAANLNVESASNINQDVTTDATPTFASTTLNTNGGSDATVNFQQGGSTTYTMGIDDTDNKFKIHSHSGLQDTSDLTIDSSGNIGLGTASPSSKLHLSSGIGANGDCELTIQADTDNDGSNESSNPRLVLNQDGGNVKSYFSHGANILGIYNCAQANGGIVFGISTENSSTINSNTSDQNISATTEVMRISNGHKIGIGTNSPVNKLEIKSDQTTANQLRLTDKDSTSENPKYTDIYQTDGHFYIKSSGSGTDIILEPSGGDIQLSYNTSTFGGFFPNSNNFHIYSARNNYAIKFQNKVSSSFQQILELNKTNNLSTFDSNIKLNGGMIFNKNTTGSANSPHNTSTITIDFSTSDASDFEIFIDDTITGSTGASYTLEYSQITDSSLVGKKGHIIITNPSGGTYSPTVSTSSSMTSGSDTWYWSTDSGFGEDAYFNTDNTKDETQIFSYYIYSTTRVFIKTVYYTSKNYTGT